MADVLFDSDTGTPSVFPGIGDAAARYYLGQGFYSLGTAKDVSKIEFYAGYISNDISGQTFIVKIFDMNGYALNNELGSSSTVSGGNISVDTWISFTFSPPISLSSGTYSFVITHSGIDATNALCLGSHTTATLSGYQAGWASDKSYGDETSNDLNIKLYEAGVTDTRLKITGEPT